MSQALAIRVDGSDKQNPLVNFLCLDGGAYFVVSESCGTENAHCHGVIHTNKKTPAFRMALKRFLGITGNGAYSVAEVRDLAKYCRYMCKGTSADVGPVVVSAYGMEYANADWQRGQHAAFWADAAAAGRKRKLENIMDVVYEECTTQGVEWHQRDRIAKIYINQLVERNRPINVFSAKSAINLIQVKLCPDDSALDNLVSTV